MMQVKKNKWLVFFLWQSPPFLLIYLLFYFWVVFDILIMVSFQIDFYLEIY